MLKKALSFAGTAIVTAALVLVFVTLPPSQIDPANAYFQKSNIYRSGLVGTKTLALTFDDGPSAFTNELLDALAANKAHATFFVVGARVHQHPEAMERMAREGHVIANHSFTHARLGRRYAQDPELLISEIGNTHRAIAAYLRPDQGLYFRAPYGVWRQVHADFLNRDPVLQKYVGPIYWDIGGNIAYDDQGHLRSAADWDCWSQNMSAEQCANGYLREIERRKGGIVLMHDIRERSLWMVKQLLPALVAQGYRFVTLDEVKELDQYKTPDAQGVPVAQGDAGFNPYGVSAR